MSALTPSPALLAELRQLIDGARQRAAAAVNAELTLLYWQVGQRIRQDILGEQRAELGVPGTENSARAKAVRQPINNSTWRTRLERHHTSLS